MGLNGTDISGAIAESIAGCRDYPDQDRLLLSDRWLGTLTVDGHGEDDGVSWVRLADPYGMRWAFLWPWRDMHVSQGSDFLIMASVDLDDDLITGEFSAPDGDGVRWLMSPAWVKSHRADLLPSGWPEDDGDREVMSTRAGPPQPGRWVEVSGVIAGWQERLRAADSAALRPWERWVAALPIKGHSESEGVSMVEFTWSPGPALGWRWAWGERRSPGEDLLGVVIDDLSEDLARGGVTKADLEDIRWLLPFEASMKPPVPWAATPGSDDNVGP